MVDGVKRTVRLGSMAYVDPDGRTLRADCGAEVLVHQGNVERFDRLNVLPGEPVPVPEDVPVKRKPGRPRKDGDDGGVRDA